MPFSPEAADRSERFFERALIHGKGEWAGQPFRLLPWQRDRIIRPLFGTLREDGTRQYRTCYCEVPRKQGKALAIDTLLPTPTGWTTMGEVAVGDTLFDEQGQPCRVTFATDVMIDRPCYRLTFSDGAVIVADAEHQWLTTARVNLVGQRKDRANRRYRMPHICQHRIGGRDYNYAQLYRRQLYLGPVGAPQVLDRFAAMAAVDIAEHPFGVDTQTRVRTTAEIAGSVCFGDRGDRNHSIPVAAPLVLPDSDLPFPPYVLGCWLGDGNTDSARITGSYEDTEIVARIQTCGVAVGEMRRDGPNSGSYRLGDGNRTQAARNCSPQAVLREMGVLGAKHIPAMYLRASFPQRLALLQGLMDTDGCIAADGGQCEFTTISERLADGFCELVISLGIKARMHRGRAKLYGRDCGPKFRITFTAKADMTVFGLSRKRVRQNAATDNSTRSNTRQIVSCEPISSVPVRCIQVDSLNGLFLAGRSMIPTHNSTLAAGLALYLLFADGEAGAEVYGAAADLDQARIVYAAAADMVRRSPLLSKRGRVIDSSKRVIYGNSFYRAIPADAAGAHGFNANGIVFDEVHVQPNRELWDVLTTSTGSRRQPLTFAITTAGFDRNSLCWELHDYALKVQNGVIDDPTFLPVVYAADETDDWRDPAVWAKANPSLGETVSVEYLANEAKRAEEVPAYENTFRRLHLNMWTRQETRWLSIDKWDGCGEPVEREDLHGRPCYAGLDLASTTDIAALVLVFPNDDGSFDVLPHFWIPGDAMVDRSRRDRVPYDVWVRQGLIEATEGNVIDYKAIMLTLDRLAQEYDLREVAYDRWGATQLIQDLQEGGMTVIPFGQGFASMSPPTKELLNLVLSKRLRHGGNPVLRWMADNMVVRTDPAGNTKPDKAKSTERIDGMVALIMAIDRATRHENSPKRSIYEDRGLAWWEDGDEESENEEAPAGIPVPV